MKEHIVKPLFSEEEVDLKIRELAARISEDYAGRQLHLIGVLKGSVPFMAELAKRLTIPATMDFMSCSSYGGGTSSSGAVRLNKDLDESLEGRDVLLVEDIIDTGHTLSYLLNLLQDRHPASLKLAALLDKPSRRTCPVEVDYSCFKIPDVFVVGYGLDYDQLYRGLPYVGYVEFV